MESGSRERPRWTPVSRRKEPSLYDEFLLSERAETQSRNPRRQSLPLGGVTAATGDTTSAGTIRVVKPEEAAAVDSSPKNEKFILPERRTTSFERKFIPQTTTTIVGGAAALTGASSPHRIPKSNRKLVKDRDLRLTSDSPPRSRNGSSVAGMLVRTSSSNGASSSGQNAQVDMGEREEHHSSRRRVKGIEDGKRERSSTDPTKKSKHRSGSVNTPSSGAEYLASVPASTSVPSAPSMSTISPPVQPPEEFAGRRSISPVSSNAESDQSSSRRIVYLMNTLKGRMSGNVLLRRDRDSAWADLYCYIKEETGQLMYEPRSVDSSHRALVSTLKGCSVRSDADGDTPYLEVTLPQSDMEIHFKLLTQSDFDSWFAALLWWQYYESRALLSNGPRPPSSGTSRRVEPPPRTSSARSHRHRADSSKSDRRKSVVTSKEAPVIKIGKMVFWDTNVGYSNSSSGAMGQPTSERPQAYRMQSFRSRRWRRISGQLRENGELKLHADADNTLISVVQLSQLSRCAIQRLDPSVLENEFCIAIYPQYTSNPTNNQPGFIRPIFLSLETRVLFEVWFVLLRAFTIPQLYGPPSATNVGGPSPGGIENDTEQRQDVEDMLATTTTDMFRLERTMSIRIVEAKMYPPTTSNSNSDTGFSGGHNRGAQAANSKLEHHGYYAEVLLDNETRAKTSIKYDGLNPLWAESFEFLDLPPVLGSASIVIKRKSPDQARAREQQDNKLVNEAYGLTSDQHGGFTGLSFDVTCGKVEIFLQELEEEKEVEKWWPVVNMYSQRVGEVLIKTRTDEGVILMARDYKPMSELLHRFINGLTLQIAQMVPTELKRVSDCLLNIFQVSGRAGDWIMALVEEEIDGIHKETPISRLRYNRRVGSDASHDTLGTGSGSTDRELIVRDLGRNATLEANLLFRGNTLLTKSLDTHMRRVGKEYLEESLGAVIKDINEKDPECEVDPNRVTSPQDSDRNWRRLIHYTQETWKAIIAAKQKCPIELRLIFRHVRACAEDRYGDFLRSVSFSSVSGFLFLRFFCPAILNPKLFGLCKEDAKPRARRTFTLIAKSLQTLSNMASFGAKETWMEPMNTFLTQNRESFKSFINDICYVPTPLSASTYQSSTSSSASYPSGSVTAETNLSYTTPMTIMQRLPPTSREGFPSLPYLIDQARAFAELIHLWLEATTAMSAATETTASAKSHAEVMAAIKASEGDLVAFHNICTSLHKRTQECLSRAERAERPRSAVSFKWEEYIDQLQPNSSIANGDDLPVPEASSMDMLAEKVAGDPSIVTSTPSPHHAHPREWDVNLDEDEEDFGTRLYDTTPPPSGSQAYDFGAPQDRPGSSGAVSNLRESLRKVRIESRASDSRSHSLTASASASNVSSAVSSDTEHTTGTTALPSYDREMRHRERVSAAKQKIKGHVEASGRQREKDKDKRKTPIVSALRKTKKEREGKGSTAAVDGAYMKGGYASHG